MAKAISRSGHFGQSSMYPICLRLFPNASDVLGLDERVIPQMREAPRPSIRKGASNMVGHKYDAATEKKGDLGPAKSHRA